MEQAQPVCLRCGRADCPGVTDSVRAAGGCTHDYSKADLAAVRCYMCGRKGHLCCAKVLAPTYRCAIVAASSLGGSLAAPVTPAGRGTGTSPCLSGC
jgi:hypothetical protein